MYKDEPYGLYKYGYTEDLPSINSNSLYNHYKEIINSAKIDLFFSGEINKEEIEKYIKQNENLQKLAEREPQVTILTSKKIEAKDPKKIEEKMDITQGKLIIGLDVETKNPDSKFPISIYNVILRRKCKFKAISKC